jgi:hypothetical protein
MILKQDEKKTINGITYTGGMEVPDEKKPEKVNLRKIDKEKEKGE